MIIRSLLLLMDASFVRARNPPSVQPVGLPAIMSSARRWSAGIVIAQA
jgi:hypothetical protein